MDKAKYIPLRFVKIQPFKCLNDDENDNDKYA